MEIYRFTSQFVETCTWQPVNGCSCAMLHKFVFERGVCLLCFALAGSPGPQDRCIEAQFHAH